MEKINWINGQAGGTPLSAENLNQMQDNIETAINNVDSKVEGTVIFNNANGVNGTVYLSDNITNYDFLEIYYFRSENDYGYVKVEAVVNRIVNLMSSFVAGSGSIIQIDTKRIQLNTNSISSLYEYFVNINSAGIAEFGSQNVMNIYKVIGYKVN